MNFKVGDILQERSFSSAAAFEGKVDFIQDDLYVVFETFNGRHCLHAWEYVVQNFHKPLKPRNNWLSKEADLQL